MDKKLVLFVDSRWRRSEGSLYTPLLFPFWGNPTSESSLFAKEMFDAHPFDINCYRITETIQEADMVLAPYRHNWLLKHDQALLEECAETARHAGLPLLIDGMGDVEYPLTFENAYILRIGGYRFIPEKGRIIVPPSSDDLLERVCDGQLQVRVKQEGERPVVGFAGWSKLSLKQRVRTLAKEAPMRLRGFFDSNYRAMEKGVFWRERALAELKRSPRVTLNLRKRDTFSGSSKTALGDMRTLRKEFVDTVLASDYALDVRGDANAATRLFEILSLGRIPVIVDTERNFPFSDAVNYRDFCLFVDFRDIKHLPDIVADFHTNVSPEQFESMQRKAREAFVKYFRLDAQMHHIVQFLRKVL